MADIVKGPAVGGWPLRAFRSDRRFIRNGPVFSPAQRSAHAHPHNQVRQGIGEEGRRKAREGQTDQALSSGNPRIAKADGDAPVQAYIAAMPGWKSDLGKRLDAIITKNVPKVNKC